MTKAVNRALAALAAILMTVTAASAQDAQPDTERYGKQKVVYHINYDGEGETSYRSAMGNIQNHINAVGAENMEIAVVMHGDGLGLLMAAKEDDALQTRVASLKSQGVSFDVCNNTLVGREISWENDLYDVWEEDIVPSGVAELSRLQGMGYTYIKP